MATSTFPHHSNPQFARRAKQKEEFVPVQATAPYNFVPLPEKVRQAAPPAPHDRYSGMTGRVECTLTTCTPTYTRSALDPAFFEKWADKVREMMKDSAARQSYAEFFHIEDAEKPVIPGSSLRGMVRSLIEIASSSKMQWVTNKQLFFRTMDGSVLSKTYVDRMGNTLPGGKLKVKSGFLRRSGEDYAIEPCEVMRVHRDLIGGRDIYEETVPKTKTPRWSSTAPVRHQYEKVRVELGDIDYAGGTIHGVTKVFPDSEPDGVPGTLVITGDIKKKHHEFVFLDPKPNTPTVKVPEALVRQFQDDDQITRWQKHAFPKDKPAKDVRDSPGSLQKEGGEPVFYLVEDGHMTFLGRAQMFRLPYLNAPVDLVPEKLRAQQDEKDEDVIDLADAIFGWVPEGTRTSSFAGRVFFEDARFDTPGPNGLWLSPPVRTPHILGSPMPTAIQHYLVQDTGQGHDPDRKKCLAHYDTPSPSETVIRGHKLYWHKADAEGVTRDFSEAHEPNWTANNSARADSQHTQIKPVREGVKFRFTVRFENLSQTELGALLWALTLPKVGEFTLRHKLGMGKPLGLGTVQIRVDNVFESSRIPQAKEDAPCSRYEKLFDERGWYLAESPLNEDTRNSTMGEFMSFVAGDAKGFNADARIKALHMLLRYYPGPAESATANMDVSQFRWRPVLPTPDQIATELGIADAKLDKEDCIVQGDQEESSTQSETLDELAKEVEAFLQNKGKAGLAPESAEKAESAPPVAESAPSQPEPPPAVMPVSDAISIVVGAIFTGSVAAVEEGRVVVRIGEQEATLMREFIRPPLAKDESIAERFTVGKPITVKVKSINAKGRTQLTMALP